MKTKQDLGNKVCTQLSDEEQRPIAESVVHKCWVPLAKSTARHQAWS